MVKKDEALVLADEFEKRFSSMNGVDVPEQVRVPRDEWRALHTAIKQALAAPVQPVAWTPGPNLFKDWCSQYFGPDVDDVYIAHAIFNLPPMAQHFAATPPAAQPAVQTWPVSQDPATQLQVAQIIAMRDSTPPVAQLAPVPLTDEQVWANDELMKLNAVMMLPMDYFMRVVRAIKAAHGITEGGAA